MSIEVGLKVDDKIQQAERTLSQNVCYVCKEIPNNKKEYARRKVCRNLIVDNEYEGNFYCILHFPIENKIEEFNKEFHKRLNEKAYIFIGVFFPTEVVLINKSFEKLLDFRWANFIYEVDFAHSTFNKELRFQEATFYKHANFVSVKFINSVNFDKTHFLGESDFENAIFEKKANFKLAKFENSTSFIKADFYQISIFKRVIFNNFADFSNSTFYKEVNFQSAKFESEANFYEVTFKDDAFFVSVIFEKTTEFSYSTFAEKNSLINFKLTQFKLDVFFRGVKFIKSAYFRSVTFSKNASFSSSTFSQNVYFTDSIFEDNSRISFRSTKFQGVCDFRYSTIKGSIVFEGGEQLIHKKSSNIYTTVFEKGNVWLDLRESRHTKAEIISFHRVRLQPSWFLNINLKDFVFTDVEWENVDNHTTKVNVQNELKWLTKRKVENAKQLFKIACHQLAENAETNNRFEEASNFRRMAFETEWLEKKEKISNWIKNLVLESEKLKRRVGGSTDEEDKPISPTNSFGILRRSGDFFIHGLYRITSFYGESWSWALGVLLSLILVIFPIIYMQIHFQTCSKDRPIATSLTICESKDEEIRKNCTCSTDQITFTDAIVQSLTTATLQNVEYRKPLTVWGEIWIILEKIFAPLQAALLALAIRRKFMR